MTLSEELEVECCDEELSEVQKSFYLDAMKEYEKAMSEANKIKKDGTSIIKNDNVWLVKSIYHVSIKNPVATSSVVSSQSPVSNPPLSSNTIQNMPHTIVLTKPSNTSVSNQPLPAVPSLHLNSRLPLAIPVVSQSSPITMPVDETAFPASQLLSKFTETTARKQQKSFASTVHAAQTQDFSVQVIQPVQITQPSQTVHPVQSTQPSQTVHPVQSNSLTGSSKKPVNVTLAKQVGQQPVQSPEIFVSSSSNPISTNQQTKTTIATSATTKKVGSSVDDSKLLSKTIPSLCVVVRPASAVPDEVNQKKRESLDLFVKSRLVLDSRRFAEWLMQVGLLRSQQIGSCRVHHSVMPPQPLQLRMYTEESRFPYSGGYVWITKCCDRNFVSIFRESIFEDSPHPPTVLLKLIYHWACQSSISNVVQWVKIDHVYLRMFYTMLRSICTVDIHSNTPMFGTSPKNNRVEIGVISLGSTLSDKRRDVKVEILGVLDQETRKIRLRASEPIVGADSRSRVRFAKILEPLTRWVSPKAVIVTDHTVDRNTLEELGFQHVVQRNLSSSLPEERCNNRSIMDYLRKTVPKVFNNTLSLLSTATIQQFLDELVWREINGQSTGDAFHNIVRDLSAQARAETGMPLIKRLPLVALDPFKDWSLKLHKSSRSNVDEASQGTPSSTSSVAIKRPGLTPKDGPSASKTMRLFSYYSTMIGSTKDALVCEPKDAETFCQHTNCQKLVKNNTEMMLHLRQHLVNDVALVEPLVESAEWSEHCNYCLETLPSKILKKLHEENNHTFLSSFTSKPHGEDSVVVKEIICLICHEKFSQNRLLEQHLEKTHVYCEMPYRCRVCQFQTSIHTQLMDHFYQNHKTSSYLLCPLCLEIFSTKGDNLAKGLETGHMQYLGHLRNHLVIPVSNRHRCKRCILTFLQYDQLRFHVRTDHISAVSNAAARPFTFTVAKPIGMKVTSSNPPAVIYSNSTVTASSFTTELVSPTTSTLNKATPSSTPSFPSAVGSRTGLKTYSKDISQDLPNTSVARRYPNVILTEETLAAANLCIECKEPLNKKNHFTGYFCCTLCRFSTCCAVGMKKHQNQVHKTKLETPMLGVVYQLSEIAKCKCGFSSNSGIEVKRHMARCEHNSVIVAST